MLVKDKSGVGVGYSASPVSFNVTTILRHRVIFYYAYIPIKTASDHFTMPPTSSFTIRI